MIQPRTNICAICGKKEKEEKYGSGWSGWGQLLGIVLNDEENPTLCIEHLKMVADFIDNLLEAK